EVETLTNGFAVNPAPDLTISKTHLGNFAQSDKGDVYTITVSNSGSAPTVGVVTMNESVPAGLTATTIGGSGWNCPTGTLTSPLVCTRSDALAAGSSYPAITLTVNVASNAPPSVTNAATVSGGGELNTGNDTAKDVTTITNNAPCLPPPANLASWWPGDGNADDI